LPSVEPIIDAYGRPFLNFRISVTQKCNLHCPYCHREGQPQSKDEMTPVEIARIAGIASELGARRVKLTGGEPLIRQDIVEIVRLLGEKETIDEISMVTNGTLLMFPLAENLKRNGLVRVNINIPSVNAETYESLTGGSLGDALEGVKAAKSAGLSPVKVNMLLLKGVNDDQTDSMMKFCCEEGATLQLIELEPLNVESKYYSQYHCSLDDIERELSSEAHKVEVRRSMHGRKVYHLGDARIEVVKPVENTEFCLRCSRMRLTSDGKLKSCLMRCDDLVDVLGSIRAGVSDQEVRRLFESSVRSRRPFYDGGSF